MFAQNPFGSHLASSLSHFIERSAGIRRFLALFPLDSNPIYVDYMKQFNGTDKKYGGKFVWDDHFTSNTLRGQDAPRIPTRVTCMSAGSNSGSSWKG